MKDGDCVEAASSLHTEQWKYASQRAKGAARHLPSALAISLIAASRPFSFAVF